MTPQPCVAEKRKHKRHPAKGEIWLAVEGDGLPEFQGRLLDVSVDGFRVSHTLTVLCPGQMVSFRHARSRGQALVVWNRILGQQVESGFRVISR